MMKRSSIGYAALLILASALSRPAVAETRMCTAISTIPYTISAPGIYCLFGDLNVALASGTAIAINASNVTLDMNRHVLSNLGAGPSNSAYGIEVNQQKNVVIENGSVQGFFIGVGLFDSAPYTTSQGNVIEDIAAARNTVFALYVEGQSNRVDHNLVTETGGPSSAIGIIAIGPDNVIRNNEVTGTGTATADGYAIYGYAATGLIVEDNRVSGVMSDVSAASYGIYLNSSSHAVIRNNSVDKADTSGAGYSRSFGIALDSSTDNAVVGNQVTAFYYGIYASSGSSAQTSGNVVIGGSVPVAGTTPATTY
jgi:nitrous oxidase accessory protein NosD